MLQFAKLTQYYVVSTIFPGMFNLLLVVFVHNKIFPEKKKMIFATEEWFFVSLTTILLTLIVGMRIEKYWHCLITIKKNPKKTVASYPNLSNWRIKLIDAVSNMDGAASNCLISYTEKVIYEYYACNNILLGLTSALVMSIIYICRSPQLNCLLISVVVISYIVVLLLMGWAMRVWLKELYKLQKK